MNGRAIASSSSPIPRMNTRCGARSMPSVVMRERSFRVGASFTCTLLRAVLGVPVTLKIIDQRRAEMTLRLFARVNRAVAPEQIERFLRDPERAAIAHSPNSARVGEPGDNALDRLVHLIGRRDLIADQASGETVARELALVL